MTELINEEEVVESRLNDAVRRILAVKLAMQLVEVPEALAAKFGYKNKNTTDEVTYTDEERLLE
jgi:beta-glucosidase-like glycosyl hydrolase